jgi:hypothetical protein
LANALDDIVFVIAPASGENARENFRRTIERAWTLDDILSLGVKLSEELKEKLRKVDKFVIWGSTPRVQGIDRFFKRLEKAGEGFVAFYQDGKIVCWGRIFAWTRNPDLAKALWPQNKQNETETWEYIYFIRDVQWARPGIPWPIVRSKLGYSEGFIPQGHTFVREERLKDIIGEYGDLFSFFNTLVNTVNTDRVSKSLNSNKSRNRYNPYLIQSLKQLDKTTLLRVIGAVALELKRLVKVSKSDAINVLENILRRYGLNQSKVHYYVASDRYTLLVNDLRRLGLIEAGDPSSEWSRETKGHLTPLVYRIAEVIEYCRNYCRGAEDECYIAGGAIAITSIFMFGKVPAASPSLQQIMTKIYQGESLDKIASEVASKIGADSSKVYDVIKNMKDLIDEAIRIVKQLSDSNCIPLLYVPLGLVLRKRTEQ